MQLKFLAVTDDQHSVQKLASIIIEIKDCVDFVHVREKSKSMQELFLLLELVEEGHVDKRKIVIHDRLDLALIKDIPNIHLPGQGLPVKSVKEYFPSLRIGRSVHSFEEARQAQLDGADYVLYGHVFRTNSKKGKPPKGLTEISEIKRKLDIPIFVIGGITPDRINGIMLANADGIAVMSGIFASDHPAAAAQLYFKRCREETDEKVL